MKFSPELIPARFLRRYKRFLADVVLPNGDQITVHCPNTGSMTNCLQEGGRCWISDSNNPKRKYRYSLEWVTTAAGYLAGINTSRANSLVVEALERGVIVELQGYEALATEKKYGSENSRIDVLLDFGERACFVEVKNLTLGFADRRGTFPDAITIRGQKHLRELMHMVAQGQRAALVFCVQHTGIDRIAPADDIDPEYGCLLRQAALAGVEVLAYAATFSESEVVLTRALPIEL